MLKILRRKGVSRIILWILAGIIILAFGVFGSVYQMEERAEKKYKYAGKVFGRKISGREFEKQFAETIIVDKINYGNNFLRIKNLLDQDRAQRTWVRIILLKEAEKRGIWVSDNDVVNFIQTYPPFLVEGKFNRLLYNDILQNFLRVQPKDFEECLRDKLKIDKITLQETASITVADDEVIEEYKKSAEKIQVSYALFANENFKNQIALDDTKAQQYYADHQNDFATPPMVNVEYLPFDFPSPTVTPTPKPANGKDIESVSEADKDATWDKAYAVYKDLKTTPDFAGVAAKHSLKIAESGFFSMEQPNLKAGWSFPMIQKIFEMKLNDISEPQETAQGFQILHIKEMKPATMPAYADIKDRVIDAWKVIEAGKVAKEKAEQTLKKIQNLAANPNFDFAKTAKSLNVDLEQTPSFAHGDYLPKLGLAPDFQEKAFLLTNTQPLSSEIAETDKGFCILYLDNRTEADMKNFDKEKEKLSKAILLDKKTKVFNDFLTHLRLKANLQDYLPAKTKADVR